MSAPTYPVSLTMKMLITVVALLSLMGCGATYTKFDKARSSAESTAHSSGAADCPNGINYKTGRCL